MSRTTDFLPDLWPFEEDEVYPAHRAALVHLQRIVREIPLYGGDVELALVTGLQGAARLTGRNEFQLANWLRSRTYVEEGSDRKRRADLASHVARAGFVALHLTLAERHPWLHKNWSFRSSIEAVCAHHLYDGPKDEEFYKRLKAMHFPSDRFQAARTLRKLLDSAERDLRDAGIYDVVKTAASFTTSSDPVLIRGRLVRELLAALLSARALDHLGSGMVVCLFTRKPPTLYGSGSIERYFLAPLQQPTADDEAEPPIDELQDSVDSLIHQLAAEGGPAT
ncbi:hypothetical protein [Kitasatospora sp. NPDC004289]